MNNMGMMVITRPNGLNTLNRISIQKSVLYMVNNVVKNENYTILKKLPKIKIPFIFWLESYTHFCVGKSLL